ncbi:MAG: formate dehydrogenase, partial [Syntrophobacteraceae bacterium]
MTAKLAVENRNPVQSLNGFLRMLLEKEIVSALLVLEHLPMKNAVMPALVTDPAKLDRADPLA